MHKLVGWVLYIGLMYSPVADCAQVHWDWRLMHIWSSRTHLVDDGQVDPEAVYIVDADVKNVCSLQR